MQYYNGNNYDGNNYRANKTRSILLVIAGGIILLPSGFFLLINLIYLFFDVCCLLITAGIISTDGSFMSGFNQVLTSTLLSGVGVAAGAALVAWGARLAEGGRK